MKVLYNILMLFGILCISSAAITERRQKRSVTCNNTLRFAEYFEHGYDISEYDIFSCTEFGGQKAKFSSLNTCDRGEKFKLINDEKTEYDVPDQFFGAHEISLTKISSGHTYSSMSDMKEEYLTPTLFEHPFDVIDGTEKEVFKNSQFYKEMESVVAKNSKVAFIYTKLGFYQLQVLAQQFQEKYFTPEFKNDVSALPEKFVGNEKPYIEFLKKYGTHVMVRANFGAALYRYSEVNSENVALRKENIINKEMRKDFPALPETLNILCETNDGHRQVVKVEVEDRKYKQVMVGGFADTTLWKSKELPLNMLKSNPALVTSEVEPISDLFTGDKQKNVEEAIKVYMIKAHIKSLVSDIQILIESGHSTRNETTAVLAKSEQLLNIYNEIELNDLENELTIELDELKLRPILKQNFN